MISIHNDSPYNTHDLKALVLRVADDVRGRKVNLKIAFGTHKGQYPHIRDGWGWIDLPLPKVAIAYGITRPELAWMIERLLWYHLGTTIQTRPDGGRFKADAYQYAEQYKIRLKPLKPETTKADKRAKKLAHAQYMLALHHSRLRRLQNIIKKWQRRVKIYSKPMPEKDSI